MRYYEDHEVGATSQGTGTYLVTAEEIIEVGRRWDPQPFHVDEAAAAESVFGGLVASTVHLFALANSLAVNGDPTAAVSALGMTDVVNHAPARPGDELSHRSVITSRRPSQSRPGLGVISVRNELSNQHGELVLTYTVAALVRSRDLGV